MTGRRISGRDGAHADRHRRIVRVPRHPPVRRVDPSRARVTALVRRPSSAPDESTWDPYAGIYDRGVIERADVVVNLAGAPTAGNPHSQKWARELRESRVTTTRLLARAIAEAEQPPAFLAGNGISWYGDHGPDVLTEESDSRGDSLLTRVTREWQAAADPAVEAGARVCVLPDLPGDGPAQRAAQQLRLVFRLGLGARLGDGEQYMPMVSLRDWVGGVAYLAEHDTARGPFNLTCPETPTNGEFTQALAAAVHRPALVVAPRTLLKVAAGQMAPELLGSLNVRPPPSSRPATASRPRRGRRARRRAGLSPHPRHAPLPGDPTEHDGPPRRPVAGQPDPDPLPDGDRVREPVGHHEHEPAGGAGPIASRRAPASASRARAARAAYARASPGRDDRPLTGPCTAPPAPPRHPPPTPRQAYVPGAQHRQRRHAPTPARRPGQSGVAARWPVTGTRGSGGVPRSGVPTTDGRPSTTPTTPAASARAW